MSGEDEMAEPLARILRLLDGVRRTNSGYVARCPAHDDRQASLSIASGDDGRVLLKCFAGCEVEAIVSGLGLEMSDLFPEETKMKKAGGRRSLPSPKRFEHSNSPQTPSSGLTLAEYAKAKRIPVEMLASFGLTEISLFKVPAVRIPYRDTTGAEVAVRFRIAMEGDRFRWRSRSKPLLYGLDRLNIAKQRDSLLLVEGESDCHTCWACDTPAIGLPGADSWREAWTDHLVEIPTLYVAIEPDRGGQRVREWLSRSSMRSRCKLLALGSHKDPSALYLACDANPATFRDRLTVYMEEALPWPDVERETTEKSLQAAYQGCSQLLSDPRLIERIEKAIIARGYAGDTMPAMLAYIAITSRRLQRPLNLALIGPSAAGKNRSVDVTLELVSPEAVFVEQAGSARALIYNDECFEHRMVVISEADSIPEDGPAASAIRSLAADNRMEYDVVERDDRTGHFTTRRISKPGPTGLITTSTKSLGDQMGTRLLEVPIRDDEEQTRQVLLAHARAVEGSLKGDEVALAPFHALQRYLQASPIKRVVIPFARILADLVPARAVRMRRDFRQLLACVQAVALLHQCQRRMVSEDCIEATLEDYAIARNLLGSIFDAIEAGGVTRAVRETIEAISPPGEELSETQLAGRLDLSKSTVHYRVKRALKGGWLVNNEKRRGYPARLTLGDPLPIEQTSLPTVEELQEGFEGSNGIREEECPLSPSSEIEVMGVRQ